jgi:hypothetical protein
MDVNASNDLHPAVLTLSSKQVKLASIPIRVPLFQNQDEDEARGTNNLFVSALRFGCVL